MPRIDIANALKESRIFAGLTCEDVAVQIGKSAKTVNAWENNRGQPDADTFVTLCGIYNVNISQLFGMDSDNEVLGNKKNTLGKSEDALVKLLNKDPKKMEKAFKILEILFEDDT